MLLWQVTKCLTSSVDIITSQRRSAQIRIRFFGVAPFRTNGSPDTRPFSPELIGNMCSESIELVESTTSRSLDTKVCMYACGKLRRCGASVIDSDRYIQQRRHSIIQSLSHYIVARNIVVQ